MPSIEVQAQQITVVSAVGGTLLLASSGELYVGANGNLIKSNGSSNIRVEIVEVFSTTSCRVRLLPESGGVQANDTVIDLSAYAGGKFYIDFQVVDTSTLAEVIGTAAQNALLYEGSRSVQTVTLNASPADNETIIVLESTGLVTFELKLADYARGTLTCVDKASLVNNETFTLDDGVNAATVFEFQVDGDFVATGGGVVVIDIQAATTAIEVAALVHAAINAVEAGLAITSINDGTATLALVNDAYGAYNTAISDTVTDAGFVHTGMAGGSAWTPTGGSVVVIDCTGLSARADIAAVVALFLSARANALYVFSSTTTGFIQTAKLLGSTYNVLTTGTALGSTSSINTPGSDPIAVVGNVNYTLLKGQSPIGTGTTVVGSTVGPDGSVEVFSSSEPTGKIPQTARSFLAPINAWYSSDGNIDFENGINQTLQLVNGNNDITGLANGEDGGTYKIALFQPESGAAGTITVTGTPPAVVGTVSGSMSVTNGKMNILTLTYFSNRGGNPYWALSLSGEL